MICFEKGFLVGKNLAIDPCRKSNAANILISHAHSDHVNLRSQGKYFFSKGTKNLVESRYGKARYSKSLPFNKKIDLDGTNISLSNSGHILGSASFLIEADKTIGYSADFKVQDSMIQKGAKSLDCDVLVLESTFGLPSFTFPERESVYQEIGSWVKQKTKTGFVVLAGYALGKAQELTAICNRYANISPLVHERVFENNEVYKKTGTNLGDYIKLNHNLKDSPVLIMPPSLVNHNLRQVLEYGLKKPVFTALATGWTFRSSYDKVFPLSDHADFPQLLDYVKQSSPKLVLTMHGYERELASYINRRLGIAAKPLASKGQKVLSEF